MPETLPAVDTPPATGVWVEHDMLELTDDEIVAGNHQGEAVDINDDDDNGHWPTTR